MTQTLFYSFLSAFCEFFGLSVLYLWEVFEKVSVNGSAFLNLAFCGGVINGIILLSLKLCTTKKEFVRFIAYGCLGLITFFLFRLQEIGLRSGAFIILGSAAFLFLNNIFMDAKKNRDLYWGLTLGLLAGVPFLPVLFLAFSFVQFNFKKSRHLLKMWALIQLPILVTQLVLSVNDLSVSNDSVSSVQVSGVYLLSCLGSYLGFLLLLKLLLLKRISWLKNSLTGLACFFLFFTSRYGDVSSQEEAYSIRFPSMGTVCEVTIWTDSKVQAEASLLEARKTFDDIEQRLSTYRKSSEISILNREAFHKEYICGDVLWQNLMIAEAGWKASNGAFDVTIGPLVKLWGIKRKRKELPTQEEIAVAKAKVGFDKLIIDHEKRTVKFSVDGQKIDFGGLTKGWAVDQVRAQLYSQGISKGIIDLGGNIYCLRESPKGKYSYKIGVKNPLQPGKIHMVAGLLGQGIATSGNYEQFIMIEGKRYTHIIDPRTGLPVNSADGVTVISDSATWCDVLSTAFFIEGQPLIEKISKENPKLNIWFVKKSLDGSIINKTYGTIWQGIENGELE